MKKPMFSFLALMFAAMATSPVTAQIKIATNGYIGIGTETPSHVVTIGPSQVYLNGYLSSTRSILFKTSDSHPRICADSKIVFYKVNQTGHISLEASAFNTVSDERLKTDIRKLSGTTSENTPLQTILKLNGYSYNWKHEVEQRQAGTPAPKRQIGFLAQEVEQLIPEAVQTSNDSTQTKSVGYHQVIPYLVEAIKEQQAVIEGLRARLDRVEGRERKASSDNSPDERPIVTLYSERMTQGNNR